MQLYCLSTIYEWVLVLHSVVVSFCGCHSAEWFFRAHPNNIFLKRLSSKIFLLGITNIYDASSVNILGLWFIIKIHEKWLWGKFEILKCTLWSSVLCSLACVKPKTALLHMETSHVILSIYSLYPVKSWPVWSVGIVFVCKDVTSPGFREACFVASYFNNSTFATRKRFSC